MGASESRQVGAGSSASAPRSGYHVVRVAANSPAHLAGIEPFFDFCVGIDGVALDGDEGVGQSAAAGSSSSSTSNGTGAGAGGMGAWKRLEEREGTQVVLNIWSSKRQELRDVPLIPSRSWSTSSGPADSNANSNSQPSLLGLTLRPCSPHQALTSVWHILDILEGSPSESAGLVPFGDWVIGYSGGVLRHEGDFYELVESFEGRPLRLYVYNADYDHTREVIIVPNREWGGEGLLGCGVGFGLLHRIPRPQDHVRPPSLADHDYTTHASQAPQGQQGQQQSHHAVLSGDGEYDHSNASVATFTSDSLRSGGGGAAAAAAAGGAIRGTIPTSSTDPNLASNLHPKSGSGGGATVGLGTNGLSQASRLRLGGYQTNGYGRDRDEAEEGDGDDEAEGDESYNSGVTVSMRREEDDDDDDDDDHVL